MFDQFKTFADAVRSRFKEMSQDTLFVVGTDNDEVWAKYLGSFPAGSNPVFRQRTEHDCSCCRHFIRDIGNVVAIQNGALVSVWDHNGLPYPYQDVADAMSAYIKSQTINSVYLTPLAKHGTPTSHELMNGATHQWSHFAVDVPKKHTTSAYVEKRGEINTTHGVLLRGLLELKPEAVDTVAELIAQNAIYRGQEFAAQVAAFQTLQARVLGTTNTKARDLLGWTRVQSPVARFRNTVIGTLVQDLSDGMDIDAAVRTYETKIAPTNYKRPTSLITKGMVQAAMKTIQELDLEQALERRHARLSDVSINSVLFVDNAVRSKMKNGVESLLMNEVRPATLDKKLAKEVGVDEFMAKVLPKATDIRLYLDNSLLGNFVSLTAPVHETTPLFRWDNGFAWSYDGNVTDSIKDKVKRAGGRVEDVVMRVSLAWFNTDDLDLHTLTPDGQRIYFCNKANILDVDMNVHNLVRDPVENMRWLRAPKDGLYQVSVHNFTRRESVDVGFVVEVESAHGLDTLSFEKGVPARTYQEVATILVKHGQIQKITPAKGVVAGSVSQEKWGVKTLDLAKVTSVILSPNYWGGHPTGNKHWFFMLEGCNNPLPARGIYNEFLHPKLEKHRKVFEVLADKTKCAPTTDQLSGAGFSSTRKDKVTVLANNKPYTIVF